MKKKNGLLILILSALVLLCNSQTKPKLRFDEILNTYQCNNSFDSIFIHSAIIALSAYPELDNISIDYKIRHLKTIMAARPQFLSIFRQRSKRGYRIILSNNINNNCEQLLCQIPYSALTGILGHELAHLLTYNNKSSIKLLFHGFKYLINKKEIERETDMIAIKRGFGRDLMDYNKYILNTNLVSKEYLENRHNNYLSVNEIQEKLD